MRWARRSREHLWSWASRREGLLGRVLETWVSALFGSMLRGLGLFRLRREGMGLFRAGCGWMIDEITVKVAWCRLPSFATHTPLNTLEVRQCCPQIWWPLLSHHATTNRHRVCWTCRIFLQWVEAGWRPVSFAHSRCHCSRMHSWPDCSPTNSGWYSTQRHPRFSRQWSGRRNSIQTKCFALRFVEGRFAISGIAGIEQQLDGFSLWIHSHSPPSCCSSQRQACSPR